MKLDQRIEGMMPRLPYRSAGEYLTKEIRPRLQRAVDNEILSIGAHQLGKFVRVTEGVDAWELVGGQKNFKRLKPMAELLTTDGGWISFAATLQPVEGGLALLAYDFERFFPDGHVEFIRFDLNFVGHPNQALGLRSHVHPGDDDWMLPAPILAPHELLDVMLARFGPRGERSERSKGRGAST